WSRATCARTPSCAPRSATTTGRASCWRARPSTRRGRRRRPDAMTAAVLFAAASEDPAQWVPALAAALLGTPVYTLGDSFDPRGVEVAIVASSAGEVLRDLPALRLVQSLWMGVDRLLAEHGSVPAHVPIARMVDPGMTREMPEAALAHVLSLHRA